MWEQIRSNQVRSIILVAGMCTLLLLIGYLFGLFFFEGPGAGLLIALIILVVMSLIAFFQGDSILLSISGARKIGRDDYPRLYNIVEEMKIAAGLPAMPAIYIIDDPALNAFATGRDPNKAAVTMTSGLLEKLNRDELQGVIGHEMSHIKNRDVLLMAISGILLGSIVILAWHASRFMFYGGMSGARGGRRSSSQGGDQAQILIAVAGSSPVQLRKPEPGQATLAPQGSGQGRVEQRREVSDLMWQLSGYSVIDCACGTRLKLPPNYGRPEVRCPHCGRIHQVQRM